MSKEQTNVCTRELMLGNKAVARGLYEAGVCFISSYPGTPSTEICAQKHVGLNVAADPLYTMSYTGVNAGFVIGVADDAGMHSSQNEQDSRHHAIAAKVPMLEPSDASEALSFTKLAYEISERFDTPVLLKMCTRVAHSQSVVTRGERTVPVRSYEKNIAKYVMMPGNAKRRHPIVEQRTLDLTAYAEDCPLNRVEMGGTQLGIITASTSYQYVKEVFGDSVSVLKLGMTNPLPEKLIRDFAAKVDRLVVVEELDPIIEDHVKALGIAVSGKDILPMTDEFSQSLIAKALGKEAPEGRSLDVNIPPRPPAMCSGCPHRGMFYTLKKNKCTVLGDIGCYTLGAVQPLGAIEMTLCMGASIGAVHGFNKILGKESEGKTVAVIGDSTFMHSGMTGLANVAYNQSNSTIIILDNSITGMTGHQQNPTTGYNIKGDPAGKIDLEALCRAMGFDHVRIADPYDLAQCDQVLKEELAYEGPSVIISRRPCVLLKYVKHNPPLTVDTDKCVGCKSCMRIGCPSISIKDGKASIDQTLCVGCEVCSQLCKFGALQAKKED